MANERSGALLLQPNPPPKGKAKRHEFPFERVEVQVPQKYVHICDPSAVDALEAVDEDSPQGLWAQELFKDEVLFMCSSYLLKDKSVNLKWKWKVWKPFTKTDMASPMSINKVLKMTNVLEDHYIYESVVALLQAHSAHDSPRGLRRLVTNNTQFWELFFSTEEKREMTKWAIQTMGGGRQLILVVQLWCLEGGGRDHDEAFTKVAKRGDSESHLIMHRGLEGNPAAKTSSSAEYATHIVHPHEQHTFLPSEESEEDFEEQWMWDQRDGGCNQVDEALCKDDNIEQSKYHHSNKYLLSKQNLQAALATEVNNPGEYATNICFRPEHTHVGQSQAIMAGFPPLVECIVAPPSVQQRFLPTESEELRGHIATEPEDCRSIGCMVSELEEFGRKWLLELPPLIDSDPESESE